MMAFYNTHEFLDNSPWLNQLEFSYHFSKVIFKIFTYKSISNLLKNIKS